jgi:DNA invertase Pin-like site-specific DNA recombinase
MMDPRRLYLYSRKSRALGDPDDPKLLDTHREALLDLARRRGVSVRPSNIRLEIGSGETIAERPTFKDLLREWEQLPEDAGGAVLVTMIDRLSRGDHADQHRIQKALCRADIRVWTPGREYDLRDVDEAFFFDIEGLFARRELSLFKKRMLMAREKLTRDGRSPNLVPPFCYLKDPVAKEWIPHPERFEVVRSWCREVERDSMLVIAARWGVAYDLVWRTLRNPAIAGWPCKRSRTTTERQRLILRNSDEWNWPERAGDYPPVVSLEEWRRIQAVIERRRVERTKRNGHANGWCRDVVQFVGYESCRVRLSSQNNSSAHRLPTYEIVTVAGARLFIARAAVHTAALDALGSLFSHPERIEEVAAEYQAARSLQAAEPRQEGQREETQKKLATVRRKLVRLEDELLGSDDSERLLALSTLRDQLTAQAQALCRQFQSVPEVLPANDAMDQLLPLLPVYLPRLGEYLEYLVGEGDCEMLYLLTTAFLAVIRVEVRKRSEHRYHRAVVAVDERW